MKIRYVTVEAIRQAGGIHYQSSSRSKLKRDTYDLVLGERQEPKATILDFQITDGVFTSHTFGTRFPRNPLHRRISCLRII